MRTHSRAWYVRKADDAFSRFIRARDGRCMVCGSRDNLTCGHLFTRTAYSTRWNVQNGYGQCAGCNLKHEHDFLPLLRVAEGIHGKAAINRLYRLHHTVSKVTNIQLEEMARYYDEKAKAIRAAV